MLRPLVVVALLALAVPVAALTRAGVELPESRLVAGRSLVLNGTGVRRKFFVDVYVGGLWLEKRTGSGPEAIRSEQAKHVELVFVRDVERAPLLEAFSEGFERNVNELAAVKPGVDALLSSITAVKKGDRMVFTYVPGKGTTFVVGGRTETVADPAFARALFSVWFGPKPSDADLKTGLLGG